MRRAGSTAATILDRLCSFVKPGLRTWEIDEEGGAMMRDFGVKISLPRSYQSHHTS